MKQKKLLIVDEVPGPAPEFLREQFAQAHFRFQRRRGLDEAEAVADAVHMHIDADAGLAERLRHHEVGRLASDAG